MSRASFGKRDREQAKRVKAEAKRQRRLALTSDEATDDEAPAEPDAQQEPTEELLRRIDEIHRLHEQGEISDDELETTKADLLGRLQID